MYCTRKSVKKTILLLTSLAFLCGLMGCTKKSTAQNSTDLQAHVKIPFHFVAYGDTRFHDPHDTDAANPSVRVALVEAIAAIDPAFVCFTGDIVYNGYDTDDWKVWDSETAIWREKNIPVYPALGNHDLHGNQKSALGNYFQRFPELKDSRYYAVHAANTMILVLDSSQDETSGSQGQWLNAKLDNIPADVNFVFVMLHHPPYTSSSDAKMFGGGHSARSPELKLAKMLEARQPNTRARFVVFAGHVHNYERHEHGGVVYFVTGGGGAHAYPIARAADDPFQSKEINYHYLLVEVNNNKLTITMHRIDLSKGTPVWTEPDSITISAPQPLSETERKSESSQRLQSHVDNFSRAKSGRFPASSLLLNPAPYHWAIKPNSNRCCCVPACQAHAKTRCLGLKTGPNWVVAAMPAGSGRSGNRTKSTNAKRLSVRILDRT